MKFFGGIAFVAATFAVVNGKAFQMETDRVLQGSAQEIISERMEKSTSTFSDMEYAQVLDFIDNKIDALVASDPGQMASNFLPKVQGMVEVAVTDLEKRKTGGIAVDSTDKKALLKELKKNLPHIAKEIVGTQTELFVQVEHKLESIAEQVISGEMKKAGDFDFSGVLASVHKFGDEYYQQIKGPEPELISIQVEGNKANPGTNQDLFANDIEAEFEHKTIIEIQDSPKHKSVVEVQDSPKHKSVVEVQDSQSLFDQDLVLPLQASSKAMQVQADTGVSSEITMSIDEEAEELAEIMKSRNKNKKIDMDLLKEKIAEVRANKAAGVSEQVFHDKIAKYKAKKVADKNKVKAYQKDVASINNIETGLKATHAHLMKSNIAHKNDITMNEHSNKFWGDLSQYEAKLDAMTKSHIADDPTASKDIMDSSKKILKKFQDLSAKEIATEAKLVGTEESLTSLKENGPAEMKAKAKEIYDRMKAKFGQDWEDTDNELFKIIRKKFEDKVSKLEGHVQEAKTAFKEIEQEEADIEFEINERLV